MAGRISRGATGQPRLHRVPMVPPGRRPDYQPAGRVRHPAGFNPPLLGPDPPSPRSLSHVPSPSHSREDAVENGEHTRPACAGGRLVRQSDGVERRTIRFDCTQREAFDARRVERHPRRARSPRRIESFQLRACFENPGARLCRPRPAAARPNLRRRQRSRVLRLVSDTAALHFQNTLLAVPSGLEFDQSDSRR